MEKILQEFWIVEKKSGRCMFNRSYGDVATDPDLLTSFLSALYRFSEEVSTKQQGIESVEMGGLKWVYIDKDNLLYIAAAEKIDKTSNIRSQVNVVRINFTKKYPESKEDDFSEKWDGNITKFEVFTEKIDELTDHWKKLEKVTDAAELMDILEVFQHIFNRLSKIIHTIKKGREQLDEKMRHLKEVLPESFQKISYSDSGWDLLTMNVFQRDINDQELIKGLSTMLKYYMDLLQEIFKEKMPQIVRSLIFPYLRSDWGRISNLKLDKLLIDLFLT
ncbi:MAG: hypothetical protein HWN67_08710 [Candidatus Helarchaeota archaeon]|nr:hypothetical protein [Candidatus Helarchaeota archaeon]